jgi:hypothetical protein
VGSAGLLPCPPTGRALLSEANADARDLRTGTLKGFLFARISYGAQACRIPPCKFTSSFIGRQVCDGEGSPSHIPIMGAEQKGGEETVKYFKIKRVWSVKAETEEEAFRQVAADPTEYLESEEVTRTEYKKTRQETGWVSGITNQLVGGSNTKRR